MTSWDVFTQTLFVTDDLDISPRAGGSHLTFLRLLKQFVERGNVPKVFVENDPQGKVLTYLKEIGCEPLTLLRAREFCQASDSQVFFYAWGPFMHHLVERIKARKYLVRPSALGAPFCSDVLRQTNGCWNQCGGLKYLAHARRNRSGLREVIQHQANVKAFTRACSLNYTSRALVELHARRFPQIERHHTGVLYEAIEAPLQAGAKWGWDKISQAEPAILLMSKWEPQKGLLDVLEVLADRYKISIVGDGSEAVRGREKYSGSSGIHWLGHIDNAHILDSLPIYRYVYLHPARWFEALGRTAIEAMHGGIPVLVPQDSGISPELGVVPGIYRYNRLKKDSLLLALEQVFSVQAEYFGAQSQSLKNEAARFAPQEVAQQWINYLESCLRI